ncbi:uncharacterized protein APUU_10314S [Aspergillus puulaauensis]|uniref:Uncharacterized protein n=1 Tax=Aspergillus puulaauensis TaxID=1220207 RepID=A0A7R8AG00_9EURO|nr:uncharacterized protein APUU_10314S [Aspergillus puulaauensis]BCS17486.1 hypothetical protein APUU_10314S [Aspergillus puulaauensis]
MANWLSLSKQEHENRFPGRTVGGISRQLLELVSYKPARGEKGGSEMSEPEVPMKRPADDIPGRRVRRKSTRYSIVDDSDDTDYVGEDPSDLKANTRTKTRQSLPRGESQQNMDIDEDFDSGKSDSASEHSCDSDPGAGDITADGEIEPYTPRRRMRRSPLYRRTSMPSLKRRSTAAIAQGKPSQDAGQAALESRPMPSNPGSPSSSARRNPHPLPPKPPSTLPMSEPRKGLSHVATHSTAAQVERERSMTDETANRLNAIRRKGDSQPDSASGPDDASAPDTSISSSEDAPAFSTPLARATTAPLIQQRQRRESITAASEPAGRGGDYIQNSTPDPVSGNAIATASILATPALGAIKPEVEIDDPAADHQCPDPAAEPDGYLSYSELNSRLAQEVARHSGSLVGSAELLAKNTCIAQIMAQSYAAQAGTLAVQLKGRELRNKNEVADFIRQIDDLNKKVDQYESQIQKLQEGTVDPRAIDELKATVEKRDEELRLQNTRAEALLQEVTERDTRISELCHEVEALTKLVEERDGRIEEFKSLTGSMGLRQMVEMASRLQEWGLVPNSNTSS